MTNWNAIVGRHGPVVFATAWRILGHVADVEDVVQEVFLEAYQLEQREPVHNWPGLLRRLAACRALDRLRQRRPTLVLDDLSLPELVAGPADVAVGRELAERLRQALSSLPEREAAVFSLRYFEELSYQEIADALTITSGAVATALHKARTRLEVLLCGALSGDCHE